MATKTTARRKPDAERIAELERELEIAGAAPARKPAARKPAAKKAPARKAANGNGAGARKVTRAEAEAAVAEIKAGRKHGEFRGIPLDLPPVLPASFAFDAIELEAAGGMQLADVRRLLVSLVGDEQWRTLRDKIAADGDPIDSVGPIMEELLKALFDPYGVSLGESLASAES